VRKSHSNRQTDTGWPIAMDLSSASEATFDDTGLTNDTTYFYRIAAFNDGGNSEYSDVVSDITFNPLFGTAQWDVDRWAE
jgi:hypothetical protein